MKQRDLPYLYVFQSNVCTVTEILREIYIASRSGNETQRKYERTTTHAPHATVTLRYR